MPSENESHFCICITPDDLSPAAKNALSGRKAALLNEARWASGNVITVKFLEGDKDLRKKVRAVAETWTEPGMANLTLSFVDSGPANVRIAFMPGKGSWSYLGTLCKSIDPGNPTMNYGWLTPDSSDEEIRRVVLHEFGHAMGLIHEHQNPLKAIQWNEPAVIRDLSGPPNNWDLETIRNNVLDRYDPATVTATPVDGASIMMYPIPKAWTLDGFSSELNGDLSAIDKDFIRECYP
jgi:serralysin